MVICREDACKVHPQALVAPTPFVFASQPDSKRVYATDPGEYLYPE